MGFRENMSFSVRLGKLENRLNDIDQDVVLLAETVKGMTAIFQDMVNSLKADMEEKKGGKND